MRLSLFSTIFLSCGLSGAASAGSDAPLAGPFADLRDREPLPKMLDLTPPRHEHRLVVKFVDAARVRLGDGALRSLGGADLGVVGRIAEEKRVEIGYRSLVPLADELADRVEREAAARTGVRPIDVRGMYEVEAPVDRLEEIGEALASLDIVEWVEFEMLRPEPPTCNDIMPLSSDLTFLQGYLGDSAGMNVEVTRSTPFVRGAGVRIGDVEYGCNPAHEDLCSVIMEPGQTISQFVYDNGWDSHGTAVLGIMNAGENGYGVTGIAPDAQAYFFPEWSNQQGPRRPGAITSAAATFDAGDIIVLEMQTIQYGDGYGPAELNSSVWSAVKNATDAGRIVIAAAGNGNENLDASVYRTYAARGDSGAIIVGAGSNGVNPTRLSFSTYGTRVNVQGWGTGVASTGYGFYTAYGSDKNQRYTSSFNGTSSATPTVAGVAAIVQGYAKEAYGVTFTSREMRDLLAETGKPQSGSGGNIGPRPDAGAIIEQIDEMFTVYCASDYNQSGEVDIVDFGTFGVRFGTSIGHVSYHTEADYNDDGVIDIIDFGVFGTEFGKTSDDCAP